MITNAATPPHCPSDTVLRTDQSPALRKACANFGERDCPPLSLLSTTAAFTTAHARPASTTIMRVTVTFTLRPLESADVYRASSPRSETFSCCFVRSAALHASRTLEPIFDALHTLSTEWRGGRSAPLLPLPSHTSSTPFLLTTACSDTLLRRTLPKKALRVAQCHSVSPPPAPTPP
jgi:hypothetical protein